MPSILWRASLWSTRAAARKFYFSLHVKVSTAMHYDINTTDVSFCREGMLQYVRVSWSFFAGETSRKPCREYKRIAHPAAAHMPTSNESRQLVNVVVARSRFRTDNGANRNVWSAASSPAKNEGDRLVCANVYGLHWSTKAPGLDGMRCA